MRKKTKLWLATSMIAMAGNQAVQAEENILPVVNVTSTTIDDRFDSKRGEASNVSNISGQKVDNRHGKNIVEVLEAIPGVTAEVQSGDSVKIMLRGIEGQRYMGEKPGVAIVIDGVPVNERTGRINIDLDNIDSIKVIKGGASYLFGEDALSGAVIITTKRGAKMAGFTASAEKGSFGYSKGLARVGIAGGNWIGHVQASKAQADDFYDQGAYSRQYLDGKLQYLISDTSDISFGFEKAIRAKDSHGTVTGVTNASLDPTSATSGGKDYARMYDVNLDKLNLTYANDLGKNGSLLLSVYEYKDHTQFKSGPSGYLRNPDGTLNGTSTSSNMGNFRDVYASQNDNNQIQTGMKGEWRKSGETVGLMGGMDLRWDEDRQIMTNLVDYTSLSTPPTATTTLKRAGAVTADGVASTRTKALYGEFKWQASAPLTLTLNARHDNIVAGYLSNLPLAAATVNPNERIFGVTSERLGANYALSPTKEIYSNISTGFRIPTATQLYGTTISPTGGSVLANPDLQPEQAVNKEIGLRAKGEMFGAPLDMDVALFQIDRNNFILNTAGQYYSDRSSPLVDQYQNIGGVRNRGLELALKTEPRNTWSGSIAYTYLEAIFTRNDTYWMTMGNGTAGSNGSGTSVLYNNTGNTVPRTPRHKINLDMRYRYSDAWTIGAEVNAQSGIYADEVNVVWIEGRTVANLTTNYEIKTAGGNNLTLFARIDNLFDRFYYTTIRGSSDSNGDGKYNAEDPSITVNPGRVWTAGMTLSF